jgi:hypothetical protein
VPAGDPAAPDGGGAVPDDDPAVPDGAGVPDGDATGPEGDAVMPGIAWPIGPAPAAALPLAVPTRGPAPSLADAGRSSDVVPGASGGLRPLLRAMEKPLAGDRSRQCGVRGGVDTPPNGRARHHRLAS